MRIKLKSILFTSLLMWVPAEHLLAAQNNTEVQEYCQSLAGSGLSDEDLSSFMNDCIAEQSSYLDQEAQYDSYQEPNYEESNYDEQSYEEPSYEDSSYDQQNYDDTYQEPQYEQDDYSLEQNCYSKVDEHIQKLLDTDPNVEFDYDRLVEQCLKGNL